jgi:hypothetical protein
MNVQPPLARATEELLAQPTFDCDWPTTNCYVDVWTLMLHSWQLDPVAGLGFTVAQDYEGDQFTFFKYQNGDLELLYGVVVSELMLYPSWEDRIAEQIRIGRPVLIEVDGYYLPDTRATCYRTQHTKTTIGIDSIDIASNHLTYFHNTGRYALSGQDYEGVFYKLAWQRPAGEVLPPYAEFVSRRWPPKSGSALTDTSVALLRRHLRRRSEQNPICRYRSDFPLHMHRLMASPHRFHDYAFAVFRQLGANYQLLASHLDWLQQNCLADLTAARDAARRLSAGAKTLQFKVARIANRGHFDACDSIFDALVRDYAAVISQLEQTFC